jgi:hypothetical protein
MFLDIKRHCGYTLDIDIIFQKALEVKGKPMSKMIFVNLPVRDLKASTAF